MSNSLDDIKLEMGPITKSWRLLLCEEQTNPTVRATLWIIRNDGGRVLVKVFPSSWPEVLYDALLVTYMRRAAFWALAYNVRDLKKNRPHDPRWDGPVSPPDA